jgi:site-specific DNA-methyltransferase (adenine-specific)
MNNDLQMIADSSSPNCCNTNVGRCFSPRIEVANNLEFMQSISSNTLDLIYCDILYGTGRNFGEYQDLKPIRSEIESHYTPRIKEMKRILKDSGCIYLQMDTRINHWLRLICDEIFGYDNFRNEISWCYNSQGKTTKQWNKKHDVILYYTKTENFVFNSDIVKDSISDLTYKRFKKEIDTTGFYTVLKNGKRTQYSLTDGSLPKDWFEDVTYISRDNKELTGYPTQKPKELLKRLILSCTNENDLVGDFYLGSGTTAVVCKELNRNFIGCDINEKAIALTNERLNNTLK